MNIEANTSLEEIRAQIVAKLRETLKIDPDVPVSQSIPNPALEELRSQLLGKVREKMGINIPALASKERDFVIDIEDMRIRMLFFRIKNSNISRGQRNALTSFVRSMAVEDRIGGKIIKSVNEMISFMEMTSTINRRNEPKIFPFEKTVDEEMKKIYSLRTQREAMRDRIDALQERLSATN